MKYTTYLLLIAMITVFLVGSTAAQQTAPAGQAGKIESEPAAEPGAESSTVEFGFRTYWGDVRGRTDLPFRPELATSKLNEYSDIRKNFYIRRANIFMRGVLGTEKYINYQTLNSLYHNQTHLATVGEYGRFKAQFRYDETPHIYTNTARFLYTETSPGVFTMPMALRQVLTTASSTGTATEINNTLPSFIATQVAPGAQFIVPQIQRKTGTGLFNYNFTPDWIAGVSFSREHQKGNRPIGAFMYTSPGAPGSTQPGTTSGRVSPASGVELPEPIDYFTNTVRAGTEYAKSKWAVQLGYNGSFFKSDIKSAIFDAPFATADVPVQIIAPGNGCTPTSGAVNCAISATPGRGQLSTYPDNHANYLNFAGAFDATKYVHVMGSASNGWLRQDEAFLPYTINSAITGLGPLPSSSLHGDKRTLAMNWTAVSKVGRSVEVEAKYRHYDYDNNTDVFSLTPIQGDVIGANSTATAQATPQVTDTEGRSNVGYNRKTLELSGNYFFGKHSSAKAGWEGEWFDRTHRDVNHSMENSVFADLDLHLFRDLSLRISGRHQDRDPDDYHDEGSFDPATGAEVHCTSTSVVFTPDQRCARRFDEAARIVDRGDATLLYNVGQFTFDGSFQTIQMDFNRPGGVNSATPLNFVPGRTRPYYLYGNMNDLSWTYTFNSTYTLSPAASVFVEYAHEKYHKRMISRTRNPISGTQTILTCGGCDTANNDWKSIARDIFDTYAGGMDLFISKRLSISPYYSLAAGKGNVFSRALGDPSITSGRDQFLLTGTSAAENYPQTTTRIHEVAAVIKFKISERLIPRFEYRLQQYDNLDYQTTPMTPYMGCVGAGPVVVSAPCVNVGANVAMKYPSPNYPGFVVGDTTAARYLFLGADQPSYRAHVITATLEYRF